MSYGSFAHQIALAAKARDWSAIDAALEHGMYAGHAEDIMRARRHDSPLPPLAGPDPVMILDLPPEVRARVRIVQQPYSGVLQWEH